MGEKLFYSAKDICEIYCIKDTKARHHMKRIKELFEIDESRLPRRGIVPANYTKQYFDQTKKV